MPFDPALDSAVAALLVDEPPDGRCAAAAAVLVQELDFESVVVAADAAVVTVLASAAHLVAEADYVVVGCSTEIGLAVAVGETVVAPVAVPAVVKPVVVVVEHAVAVVRLAAAVEHAAAAGPESALAHSELGLGPAAVAAAVVVAAAVAAAVVGLGLVVRDVELPHSLVLPEEVPAIGILLVAEA